MSATLVEKCGLCDSPNLEEVLDVGSSPLTCNMAHVGTRTVETHYPLVLLRCSDCTLVQLSVVPDPSLVFPADYPYSSGNSRALHENFEDLAKQASELVALKSWERVVDIGANDGTLLSKFTGSDYLTGIEPTDQAYKIGEMGAGFYRQPFTEKLANNFVMLYGKAKVVTACNVLAHVHDIHDVMRGINVLLADDGILVTENHDLRSLIRGQWDTVYHEHLRYWDTTSFHNLLMMHGFRAEDWQDIPTHGGSFRTFSVKGPDQGDALPEYDWESLRIRAVEDRDYLRAQARGVAGIGATARATTIINYCGLDVEDVEYVAEVSGSDKIGRYVPGTRIPIVDEQRLFEEQRPAILFSWHMADIIGPKLRERGYRGEMILPLQPA
jgi:SAM-dependent methyltransferase